MSLHQNARIFFRIFVTRLSISIYAKPNLSEGEALRVDLSLATATAMLVAYRRHIARGVGYDQRISRRWQPRSHNKRVRTDQGRGDLGGK